MGAVYLAKRDDGKIVALKVLPRSLAQDGETLERFEREAAVAMGLDHPNIVDCLDVDEADGYHYMAMEYVPGGDAEDLLYQSGGRVPERRVFEIGLDIARALECANTFGLVHRDLKPENILFAQNGLARLTDFGLVKRELSYGRITQFGKAMGTPHFMSPEQARGQRMLDVRTDFFSLGSTMYYLLSGQTPYEGESAYEIVTKLATEEPIPIQMLVKDVSQQGAMLISHLMARDPEDRPQNPAALIDLFELHLGGHRLPPLPPYGIMERRPHEEEVQVLHSTWDEVSQRKRRGESSENDPFDRFEPAAPPPDSPHAASDSSHRRKNRQEGDPNRVMAAGPGGAFAVAEEPNVGMIVAGIVAGGVAMVILLVFLVILLAP